MVSYDIRTGIKKIKTKTALAVTGATLGTASLVMAVAMPLAAKAATTVVVTPANTQGWSTADTRANGHVDYVPDTTAPLGNSALELSTDANPVSGQDKAQYMHAANEQLANITELSYATKQNSASCPCGDASYQLAVNLTGNSGFTTLVFEPYWQNNQNPDAAPVEAGHWQSWDVDSGYFWSSRQVACGNNTINAGGGGPPFYTLADIKSMCPSAIVQEFGVNIGSGNPDYNIETDAVDFNGTTYNFELANTPTSKADCKKGGYLNYTDENGNAFTSQGQCVSWVEHNVLGNGNVTKIKNTNDIDVVNVNSQSAGTGNAKVIGSTKGGNATSGDAGNQNTNNANIKVSNF